MNKFTTISKLRQVGNSTGLILNADDLNSINAEEGDEVFLQVRKVPSKQDLLDHMWDKLNEEELEALSKAAETASPHDDSGGIGCQSVGYSNVQWSEFIYNNPWTAKQLGDSKS